MRRIKGLRHWIDAFCANLVYGFPGQKLKVIGVTGTDGKTTTCFYLYEILKAAGKNVALITSIGAKIGNQTLDTGLHTTTPDPWQLQKILQEAQKKEVEFVVLEVTSHAIDQQRIFGIPFVVGVLTNITHEHLDYHRSLQAYEQTKRKFLNSCRLRVDLTDERTLQQLKSDFPQLPVRLLGSYNYFNALASAGAARLLGISPDEIRQGIENLVEVLGRMQTVYDETFKVVIDFAHTPNALKQALKEALKLKSAEAKLMVVFGCAGERDWQKRPLMGEIATQLTDLVVLTAEDPRGESLESILEQIAVGCRRTGGREGKTFWKIPDRQAAIEFAINSAKTGDVVLITGKGHEKSMCFGKTEYPWSDFEAVKKALATRSD